ncbi:MFS transporter [Mucilaginibacter sp. SMC90]|uniref:MFS transporter n=1 Tax=Mucilaginibacter sp. SMC90 TaxID=2929803 RepID=UPI001FB2E67C|nr:MFS transporter [Mucilaginibacter sp. SMC90]UOE46498.1 MFS transporter [Mucilaginibacter sp. SMC90]
MEAKNNKKTIWAWCMFDWANQSYNMVITSTIFPAYFVYVTTNNPQKTDIVSFFGHKYVNTVLSNYILGLSYLIVAVLLPILTSIADYRGNKRLYLQLFTWLGSLACAGLYFFRQESPLEIPMICFGLASIGYCGGFVFYNSYLPQIATVDQQDAVSAKGFIYGYVGSIVVQLICFLVVLKPEYFGIKEVNYLPARISFLIVFFWWIGFSFIAFRILPKGTPNAGSHNYNVLTGGFKELAKVFGKIKKMPLLKRFLSAFFFYSVGVQTIMLVAANFAAKELHMPDDDLITIILIIQVVAVLGAVIASKASAKYGNTKALVGLVAVWTMVCCSVYFVTNEWQFAIAAVVVGVVMGGVQSLSRSTYSKYLPENIPDTASYFSFYDVTEKLSIVVGLFCFGFVESMTHEMRDSALALDCFFAVGLILLIVLLVAENKVVKQTATVSV